MAKKNPPPMPPLRHLAATLPQQRDVRELQMFLFLLWEQLGGGDDSFELLQNDIDTHVSAVSAQAKMAFAEIQRLAEPPPRRLVSGNTATVGNELIVAVAGCTIALNTTPQDAERVIVQTTVRDPVTIVGPINEGTNLVLHVPFDTVDLEYVLDLSRWVIA